MKILRYLTFVLACSTVTATAHHSRGAYDVDATITLSGTVRQVSWRNPHVYITLESVTGGSAETWTLEGHSISGMLGNGWQKDSVNVGDKVTAIVNPGRGTGRKSGLIDHFRSDAGGVFYAFRRPPDNAPDGALPREIEPSTDFSGTWAFRRPLRQVLLFSTPDFASMPLNAAGRELARKFDMNDNPAFNCESAGVPRMILTAYGYRWTRHVERIVIEKEQADREDIRTIYLDGRQMPADFAPSTIGFSVGRFEEGGALLVVETTGFTPTKWGITTGIDSSEQKKLTERYRLTNGGLKIIAEYEVTDPVNLDSALTGVGVYDKGPDREFVWEPCSVDAATRHLQFEEATPAQR